MRPGNGRWINASDLVAHGTARFASPEEGRGPSVRAEGDQDGQKTLIFGVRIRPRMLPPPPKKGVFTVQKGGEALFVQGYLPAGLYTVVQRI